MNYLLLFTLFFFFTILTPVAGGLGPQPNGFEDQKSPRSLLIKVLLQNGCTNKLVAHYIIDAFRSSVPNNEVIRRLAGTTGYTTSILHLYDWLYY